MSSPRWTQQIKNLFSPSAKFPDSRPTKAINITPIQDGDDDSLEIPLEQYEDTIQNNKSNQEQPSEVIQHILSNLLKETNLPGPIYKAFTCMGYSEPVDFAIIDLEEMQKLNPQLTPGNWRHLQNLQEYYFHSMDRYEVDHLDNTQWLLITYADIKELQVLQSKNRRNHNIAPSPTVSFNHEFTPTPVTPTSQADDISINPSVQQQDVPKAKSMTTSQSTQQQDFPRAKSIRESIKMDPNAYPEFKEDRQYESWITSVRAYANLHGTMNVLDPNYIPDDIWKQEDFEEQQAFMWSVVVLKVTSPSGKIYIRNNPGDAQKIFHLLHEEHRESLKAEYNAEEVKRQIEALKLDSWSGTYVSFIQKWDSLLHLYDDLTVNKGTNTGIVALSDSGKEGDRSI